jgi:hypothetical protein
MAIDILKERHTPDVWKAIDRYRSINIPNLYGIIVEYLLIDKEPTFEDELHANAWEFVKSHLKDEQS